MAYKRVSPSEPVNASGQASKLPWTAGDRITDPDDNPLVIESEKSWEDDDFVAPENPTPISIELNPLVRYYYCDTTNEDITLELPAISASTRKVVFTVKLDIKPGSNTVTVLPNGADTIDGDSSLVISTLKQSLNIRCPSTGTDWKLH